MINKFRALLKMYSFELSSGAVIMMIITPLIASFANKEISFLAAMPLFVSFGLLIDSNPQRGSASKLNKSIALMPISLNVQYLFRFMLKITALSLFWSIYFLILTLIIPFYNKEILELLPIVVLSTKISLLFILMFDIMEDLEKILIRKKKLIRALITYSTILIYIAAIFTVYYIFNSKYIGLDSFEMMSNPFDPIFYVYLALVIIFDYLLFMRRKEY